MQTEPKFVTKRVGWILCLSCLTLLVGLAPSRTALAAGKSSWLGKKVLWIDSYSADYEWSQGIESGIRTALSGMGVELSIARLDTKRKTERAERRQAGAMAKQLIEEFKPDLIIASDDNAQEYVIVPYVKGSPTPVVFCGVNWDASPYGYPAPNITGMIEIEPVAPLYERLRRNAKGPRVVFLSGDSETMRKIRDAYVQRVFPQGLPAVFVKSFEEFKEEYLRLQQDADMLIFVNNAEIPGWNAADATALIESETRIPTGSVTPWMAPYTTFVMGKDPSEQGEFAGYAALDILNGVAPEAIPIAVNERFPLTVNLKLAEAAGVSVPLSIQRTATIYSRDGGCD